MDRSARLVERLEGLLQDGELTDDEVDALVELLTPDPADRRPGLETVLFVAEHPTIADDLRTHRLPDRLEEAIGRALEAVMPLLGIRPMGPPFKIAELARTHLEQERRKYELVVDRLEEGEMDGPAMVARYIDTDPAPLFLNRLRRTFAEVVEAAEAHSGPDRLRDHWPDTDEVLGRLWNPEKWNDDEAERLRAWLEARDDPGDAVAEGLASESIDEQLLGGVAMAWFEQPELASGALRRVVDGTEAAPQLAVLIGSTVERRARNAFSQFVAEVSWQNPELPEAELTEQRVRAILSARSVLPKVGSPMEPMTRDRLPDSVEDESLRSIPERVNQFWAFWQSVVA